MAISALVRGLLRVVLAAAAFLALFAVMTGALTLVLAVWLGTDVFDPRSLYLGAICGLIAWLFLAVFLLRKETLHVPFAHRNVFLQRVKTVLGELGYEPILEMEDHIRFRPCFAAPVMGGGIVVRANDNAGTITGPRVSLERVRKRLRLFQHLAHVQQSVQEGRRRAAEGLLKRVQVSLRLPPAQWAEVLDHLLGVLGKEETLVCEVQLLAQSSQGIRDDVVEEQVRNWLHARGIAAEIRKEHALLGDSAVMSPRAENRLPIGV